MNFLGSLGEYQNTQPRARGAKIHFVWEGEVSSPVPFDEYGCDKPNLLYDFNGSGEHYLNNDPRYFLPYRSEGLKVQYIEFDNDEVFLEGWVQFKKGLAQLFYNKGLFKKYLRVAAFRYREKLEEDAATGNIKISIQRG